MNMPLLLKIAAAGTAFLSGAIMVVFYLATSPNAQTLHTRGGQATVQEQVGSRAFDPSHQKPLVYQSGGITLQLGGAPNNFYLEVESLGQARSMVKLPTDLVQVENIKGTQAGKSILTGMVNGSVSKVVILDAHPSVIDEFLAYRPAPSPDGQSVAFIKFYPPHFVEGTTDQVMIYDLTRTPSGNRPVVTSVSDNTQVGFGGYPPGVKAITLNTNLPDSDIIHVTSEFFWAPNSASFVFSTQQAEIDAGQQSQNVHVARKEVNVVLVDVRTRRSRLFKVTMCAPRGKPCVNQLRQAQFDASGITMQFQGLGISVPTQLLVNFDKFLAQ